MVQYSFKQPDQSLALRSLPGRATIDINEPPEVPAACESGLLLLPYEVRQRIWQFVLPSDCFPWSFSGCKINHGHTPGCIAKSSCCLKRHRHPETFLGCTNLLLVCSQIYLEAIERLHQEEKVIELSGRYRSVLRQPLEFGKPGYFRSYKASTKCYIPREYDALQVMRLRKLQLHVIFPDVVAQSELDRDEGDRVYRRALASTTRNIAEVARTLAKSTNLAVVRIVLDRQVDEDASGPASPKRHHPDMLKHLRSIISAAIHAGFRLVIQAQEESAEASSADDPLAEALMIEAKEAGVDARLVLTPLPVPEEAPGWSWSGSGGWSDVDPSELGSDFPTTSDISPDDHTTTTEEDDGSGRPVMVENEVEFVASAKQAYELVPECRTCYALFGTWEGLATHLEETPKHRRSFTPKTFNTLDKYAQSGLGERKCYTCARNFGTEDGFKKHAKKWRHGRKGIIPKYREHNGWWNRKWARHEERYGWI